MADHLFRRLVSALGRWPVARQIADLGNGHAAPHGATAHDTAPHDPAVSPATRAMRSRLEGTRAVASVCPYCAVGCGTLIHVRDGRVAEVEGDPKSPINQGTLCPKGADIYQYTVNPDRLTTALYRPPHGTRWERVSLEWAMDQITDRMQDTRDRTWTASDAKGRPLRHTRAVGFLGGAALDNEENYLIKKLCVGLGIVAVENQARI
ncbi:MAG TPA: hypothetical protein VFW66_07840 [Gemmatimonadales bacterium]|nr:hypothetical protein [Gemmatimonadales bacterium]